MHGVYRTEDSHHTSEITKHKSTDGIKRLYYSTSVTCTVENYCLLYGHREILKGRSVNSHLLDLRGCKDKKLTWKCRRGYMWTWTWIYMDYADARRHLVIVCGIESLPLPAHLSNQFTNYWLYLAKVPPLFTLLRITRGNNFAQNQVHIAHRPVLFAPSPLLTITIICHGHQATNRQYKSSSKKSAWRYASDLEQNFSEISQISLPENITYGRCHQ